MPKHEKPLHLDMSFDEALRRYVQTDPRELTAPKKKAKRKKRASPRRAAVVLSSEKRPD